MPAAPPSTPRRPRRVRPVHVSCRLRARPGDLSRFVLPCRGAAGSPMSIAQRTPGMRAASAACPPGARHGRSRLVLAAYAWNASRSGRRPILRQPAGSRVSTTRQSSRHRWPRRAGTPPAPKQTTTGRGVLSGARSVLPRAMSSRCTSPRSSRLGSRDPFCLASGSRSSSSLLCSYPRSLSSDLPGADTNQCRRGVVRERGPRQRRTWSSSAGRESGDEEGSS